MDKKQRIRNIPLAFWVLILLSVGLFSLWGSLSWHYTQQWLHTLWLACENGLQSINDYLLIFGALFLPLLGLLSFLRAGISGGYQLKSTHQFSRYFLPLKQNPPKKLQTLLKTQNIAVEDVVYLNLSTPYTFCLGFLKPKIWITDGLVNLLSNEELTAVLAHEVYHLQQYDPLKLLFSRTLKPAFFFLPLMGKLADLAELQQEIAADQAAIGYLDDDLPLLSAIQKLLKQSKITKNLPVATYCPLNITEARLKRLIYPAQPCLFNWQQVFNDWLVNLAIIIFLSSTVFFSIDAKLPSTKISLANTKIPHCIVDSNNQFETEFQFETELSLLVKR